jgi:hypothetical protein
MAIEQNVVNPFGSREDFGVSDGQWSLGGQIGPAEGDNGGGDNGGDDNGGGDNGGGDNGGGDNGGGTSTTKRFVAIQANPANVAWSTDGVAWTESTTKPSATTLGDVAYGNGVFVIVGHNDKFAYSLDGGENWTDATVSPQYAGQNWSSVTYGNGMFVAVGPDSYKMHMAYSEDGINWSFQYTYGSGPFTGFDINEISFGNGYFIVSRENSYRLWVSPNITTWTSYNWPEYNPSEESLGISSFASDGTNIIGISQSPIVIKYSPTTTSLSTSSIVNKLWQGISYGASRYVAVGQTTPNAAYSVDGGQSWSLVSAPLPDGGMMGWQDVAFGNNKFVALGYGGQIATSSNGVAWTEATVSTPNSIDSGGNWSDITYGEWSE